MRLVSGRALFVAVAFVAFACVACGHDSAKPKGAPASSTSTGSSALDVTTSTAVPPAVAQLNALLLAPDDLGVTFKNSLLDAPTDTQQPCGQPDPRSVVRPDARVVALLSDYIDGIGVAENLSKFATADDTQRVMTLLREGVSCGQGTITNAGSAAPANLSSIQDVAASVDAPDAFSVVVSVAGSSPITTIAARVDVYVVVLQIGTTGNATGLDPLQIAKQAVDKIAHG